MNCPLSPVILLCIKNGFYPLALFLPNPWISTRMCNRKNDNYSIQFIHPVMNLIEELIKNSTSSFFVAKLKTKWNMANGFDFQLQRIIKPLP